MTPAAKLLCYKKTKQYNTYSKVISGLLTLTVVSVSLVTIKGGICLSPLMGVIGFRLETMLRIYGEISNLIPYGYVQSFLP